jgi:hypothetical protein
MRTSERGTICGMRRVVVNLGFWMVATLLAFPQESAVVELPVTIKSPTVPQAEREQISKQFQKNSFPLDELQERLRVAFQERGYFKVTVEEPALLKGESPQSAAITVRVTEGQKFYLREISFEGSSEIPAERMRQLFRIKSGDLFRISDIRGGLDELRKLFGKAGYVNFTAVPETIADDSEAVIDLVIDIDAGPPYFFGPLILNGPEPRAGVGRILLESYRPMIGKRYDSEWMERWGSEHKKLFAPDSSIEQALEFSLDQKEHVITVRLSF